MPENQNIIKDTLHFSSSNIIQQASGILSSILIARFLGPYLTGVWTGLKLLLNYSDSFSLGIRHGMNLELPLNLGKGELEKAELIKSTGFICSIVCAILISSGIITMYVLQSQGISLIVILGLLTVFILSVSQEINKLYMSLFRIEKRVFILSKVNIIYSFVYLLLVILIVSRFSIFGLYGVVALATLVQLSVLLLASRYLPPLRVDRKILRSLFKTGVPILGLGFLVTVLLSLDKIMIIKFLNTTELGYYSIAIFTGTLIMYVPDALSFIMFPRFVERLGQTDDIGSLENFLVKPTLILAYLLPLVIGVLYFMTPLFVQLVLPTFTPSLEPIKIITVGMFFAGISGMPDTFIVSQKKFVSAYAVKLVDIGVALGLYALVLHSGGGIKGIALGFVATQFVNTTILLVISYHHYERRVIKQLAILMEIYLPFLICVGTILLIEMVLSRHIHKVGNIYLQNGAQWIIFSIIVLPLVYYTQVKYKFISMLRQTIFRFV